MIGVMPTITIDVPDELGDGLAEAARQRGHATPGDLLAEVAADLAAGAGFLWFDDAAATPPEPPAEVLAEVRRRQETPLSECRPMEEFFDELEVKVRCIAAEQEPEARQKFA